MSKIEMNMHISGICHSQHYKHAMMKKTMNYKQHGNQAMTDVNMDSKREYDIYLTF